MNFFKKSLFSILFLLVFLCHKVNAEKVVHVYNWNQYIAPSVIPGFEKKTGINVIYDVFDTNETLQAKLLSGESGYDVVVPSNDFMARQIQSGAFMPLDRKKIPNWKGLDKSLMKKLEVNDPGNKYGIPYMIDITGIGYNQAQVKKALGKLPFPKDSWKLVFDPVYMKRLSSCGVAFLDSPTEIMASILLYKGLDPNSTLSSDYQQAAHVLETLRPYIRYFNSAMYLSDLANGNICVAIGWNGDVMMANHAAKKAKNGVSIDFTIPKEGALISFDMLAIPKGAPNYDNALTFINYLLEPRVMAANTDVIFYGNAIGKSKKWSSKSIRESHAIYPGDEEMKRLVVPKTASPRIARLVTRLWDKAKTGY